MAKAASVESRGDERSVGQWHRFEAAAAEHRSQRRAVRSAFAGLAGYFSSQGGTADEGRALSMTR